MKAFVPITILLLIAWLLGGSWWYSKTCCSFQPAAVANNTSATTASPPTISATATRQLHIADEPRFRTTAKDNLLFTNGGFDFNKPLSPELTKAYRDIAAYLKANPKRSLKLTGIYGKNEKNTSLLSNMGLARAANLKQYLESIGVNNKQLVTDSYLAPDFKLEGGQLIGGIQYKFEGLAEAPTLTPAAAKTATDRLAQIERDLKARPIILYFETAGSSVNINEKTRQQFTDLIYYLEQKPDKKALVVGHTDDVGNANLNLKYGSQRAEFAKSYMVTNGLTGARIATASKGEEQPIESNETAEGRAKNRRAEITIQ